MNRQMIKIFWGIFLYTIFATSVYAGQIVEVTCQDCGYNIGEFFLDTGMMGGADMVLAYCSACNSIIAVDQEEDRSHWVCSKCGADSSNIYRDGDELDGTTFTLHCPKCGSENLNRQRVGFWD